MDKRKVIFFTDELNEEFSIAKITPKTIDGNYNYLFDTWFQKALNFVCYRVIATPFAFIYTKLNFKHKIVGKKALKKFKKVGYFMYGNHTQDIGDAFLPCAITFPKMNYTIVHPNNVSMPVLGRINPYLGALPLPDDKDAYRNFIKAIQKRVSQNHSIVIYPEAHIWPYYTMIRPFSDVSFTYPVKLNTPVFCFTNTYQKRRFSQKIKIVTYLDGPFYPDLDIPLRKRKTALRDEVYKCMCERAKNNTVEKIKYIRKEDENG